MTPWLPVRSDLAGGAASDPRAGGGSSTTPLEAAALGFLLPPLALAAYALSRPWAIPWLLAATLGTGAVLGMAVGLSALQRRRRLGDGADQVDGAEPAASSGTHHHAPASRSIGRDSLAALADRAVGLGLAGLVGLVYLRTLSPTTDIGDSLELEVVASRLTFAHSPGYSLYTLLGKLYTLLPWRDIASRMNLYSAHAATIAVVLVYAFTARLTRSKPAGLIAALLVAFSPAFWRQAVTTEVYALNSLLVLAVLYCLLRWQDGLDTAAARSRGPLSLLRSWRGQPGGTPSRDGHQRDARVPDGSRRGARTWLLWLLATAFLLGLAMVHHPTAWSLVPVVLAAIVINAPRELYRPRVLVAVAIAFAVGLSPLLYFVLRSPAVIGHRMTGSELWSFATASGYRPLFHADRALADPTRLLLYAHEVWRQFGGLPLALAAIGIAWLWRRRWQWLLALGFYYAAIVAFRIGYYVWDGWVVQTPSHLMVAVAAGAGLAGIAELVGRGRGQAQAEASNSDWPWTRGLRARRSSASAPIDGSPRGGVLRGLTTTVVWTLLGLLVAARLWSVGPEADMSAGWPGYARASQALAQAMPPGSWIVTDPDLGSGLLYDQLIKGLRPDVNVVYADTGAGGRVLDDPAAVGHPVYLLDLPPPTDPALHLRSLGPLVEVGAAPLDRVPSGFIRPASSSPVSAAPAESSSPRIEGAASLPPVILEGVRVQPARPGTVHPGQDLGVTLLWRATGVISDDLESEVLLLCEQSGVSGRARSRPVGGGYPTTAWRRGELVPDWHKLQVDVDAKPGSCDLQALLVDREGTTRAEWPRLATVSVTPPTALADLGARQPERPVDVRWGDSLRLAGYDAPAAVRAGDRTTARLYWEITPKNLPLDLAVDVDWAPSERSTIQFDDEVVGGPTAATRQLVVTSHEFTVRDDNQAAGLVTGLVVRLGQERLAYRTASWPFVQAGPYRLPAIEVRKPASSLIHRFGDGLRLVDYGGPRVARPGERVFVPLDWEAYAPPTRRYSAFVHVLDATEAQRAGVDREILHAAEPTNEWRQGQLMHDVMPLDLPRELAPGGYRVQVGLYDQATKAPLPLVGEDGREIDGGRVLFPLLVVPRTLPKLDIAADAKFGDEVALDAVGVAPAGGAVAGQPLTVTLRLATLRRPDHDYSAFIHFGRGDQILAQADGQPFGGLVPMSAWPVGQEVDVPFALQIPADVAPGSYEVGAGLYDLASGRRLAVAERGLTAAGGAAAKDGATAEDGATADSAGGGVVETRGDQVVLHVNVR